MGAVTPSIPQDGFEGMGDIEPTELQRLEQELAEYDGIAEVVGLIAAEMAMAHTSVSILAAARWGEGRSDLERASACRNTIAAFAKVKKILDGYRG